MPTKKVMHVLASELHEFDKQHLQTLHVINLNPHFETHVRVTAPHVHQHIVIFGVAVELSRSFPPWQGGIIEQFLQFQNVGTVESSQHVLCLFQELYLAVCGVFPACVWFIIKDWRNGWSFETYISHSLPASPAFTKIYMYEEVCKNVNR